KGALHCPSCSAVVTLRTAARRAEQPVLDTIACACSKSLRDQLPSEPMAKATPDGLVWPDVPIGSNRQMFQASALARNKLTTTASFFSERNLAALAALRAEIQRVTDPDIRSKLLFVFTAILTRASKRYQWSRKR